MLAGLMERLALVPERGDLRALLVGQTASVAKAKAKMVALMRCPSDVRCPTATT